MATLAQGQAARLDLKASQSITVTPSTSGQATVSANGPSNLTYEQKTIYAAETFGPYVADTNIVISAVIGSLDYTDPVTSVPGVYEDEDGNYAFTMPDGSVSVLSALYDPVILTASGVVLAAPGVLGGWTCTVAAGTLTIYDNTAGSGDLILPATTLALGPMPIFGAGVNGALQTVTGAYAVFSDASARAYFWTA